MNSGLIRLLAWSTLAFSLSAAPLTGWSENFSGQVSKDSDSYPNAITKSMTLTPGAGTFSADKLGFNRQVAITLYNPNPYPMRFDTVQRIGKEYSWIVPANSSRTVAFRYFNPVSDEVRFLTYQDPSSLVISQGKVTQPPSAVAEQTTQSNVESTAIGPTPPMTPAEDNAKTGQSGTPAPSESRSAVRGYW